MVELETIILKFGKHGEKSGWTYILIQEDVAQELKPGNKKSFRVKGRLDDYAFKNVALLPMGKGEFILPLNATMRKNIGKRNGAMISVKLAVDTSEFKFNSDFLECLSEDQPAQIFFNTLSKSHQRYFSKWIDTAKTPETKARRIANCLDALSRRMDYGLMLRSLKKVIK